jgi:hypothetical protein
MITKTKIVLALVLVTTLLLLSFGAKTSAFDPFGSNTCKDKGTSSAVCKDVSNQNKCQNGIINNPGQPNNGTQCIENPAVKIIKSAANIIALIAGVAAIILIVSSGFSFVTSGGNSEAVANARRRIIYSLAGLVVIALAWTIIRFITDRVIK